MNDFIEKQIEEVSDRIAELQKQFIPFDEYQEAVREEPTEKLDKDIEDKTETVLTTNQVELLSTGPEAFQSLEKSIEGAKDSVEINMFSWAPDSTGMRMIEVLEEAKKKNPDLTMRVKVDKLGTFLVGSKEELKAKSKELSTMVSIGMKFAKYDHLSKDMLDGLKDDPSKIYDFSDDAKKDLQLFLDEVLTPDVLMEINPAMKRLKEMGAELKIEENPLDKMDHSKVVVVDYESAYSGGMNFGDDYSGGYEAGKGWTGKVKKDYWKDYMVHVKGPASDIQRQLFIGETLYIPQKMAFGPGQAKLRILRNAGGEVPKSASEKERAKMKQITYAAYHLLDKAEKTVQIEHAYLMDQGVVDRMRKAAARGVKITILRSQPESKGLEAVNAKFFKQIEGVPNIEIHKIPRVSHTKLMRVDGNYSLIGSANLSRASLHHHEEVSYLVSGESDFNKSIGRQLDAITAIARKYEAKRTGVLQAGKEGRADGSAG